MSRSIKTPAPALTVRPVRALVHDFPGWGIVQASGFDERYFITHPAGSSVLITGTESHGAAPYTRLQLRFQDGSRAYGQDPAVIAR